MSKTRVRTTLLIALCCLSMTTTAFARGKKAAPTEPGTYKDWRGEIDQIEIVNSFKLADYKKVVIVPLDTRETPLPEKDDNTYKPVKQVLASPDDSFLEGLRDELPKGSVAVEEGEKGGEGTLVVRARIEMMDPGSQAARYFAGFGAGAAKTKIVGEVVDGKTKQVLFRFEQERRSGVGIAGGDYVSLMNRNLKAIGEDLALIFKSF